MTGGIALINMVGGFPGGFADRYLIGFAHEKTGSNGRALREWEPERFLKDVPRLVTHAAMIAPTRPLARARR